MRKWQNRVPSGGQIGKNLGSICHFTVHPPPSIVSAYTAPPGNPRLPPPSICLIQPLPPTHCLPCLPHAAVCQKQHSHSSTSSMVESGSTAGTIGCWVKGGLGSGAVINKTRLHLKWDTPSHEILLTSTNLVAYFKKALLM